MSEDNNRSSGGGRGAPPSWRPTNQPTRIGRIGAWNSSSESSGNRGFDEDGDEDDENQPTGEDSRETWFAGGERRQVLALYSLARCTHMFDRSGISVQNPDRSRGPGGNMVRDILRRAAEGGPPSSQPVSRSTAFTGGGHRLGSDEVESTFVPDLEASTNDQETVIRHLTLWQDGFSIEDGELMRYDDPANAQILNEINEGRAPPSILNVLPGQPVELRLSKRTHETFVPPKRAAFHGTGHRLGAPVPPFAAESSQASSMPGSFPGASAPSGSSAAGERSSLSTLFEVDQTQPTTSVQIRLADGTRMVCRMNLTHTVQDIRNFINASRPENNTREYTIGTAFPNRNLEDNSLTIKDAGLANSVVIQKWA